MHCDDFTTVDQILNKFLVGLVCPIQIENMGFRPAALVADPINAEAMPTEACASAMRPAEP